MKKSIKILVISMFLLISILSFNSVKAAAYTLGGDVKFEQVKIETINAKVEQDKTMNDTISKIFGIVAYICYGIAVCIIIYKGVEFMTGEPEDKAKIKKEMIAIVIGAVIIFAIRTIIQIVYNLQSSVL